jgi:hypothetical protein
MEVQVTGVDPEPARKLAIRHVLRVGGAKRLEDAESQRVAECLQLLRLVERQDVQKRLGLGGGHGRCIHLGSAAV